MKHLLANFGVNMVALGCIGIAGYLATHAQDGWGWFLFLGVCCAGTAKISESKR